MHCCKQSDGQPMRKNIWWISVTFSMGLSWLARFRANLSSSPLVVRCPSGGVERSINFCFHLRRPARFLLMEAAQLTVRSVPE
jgi:hypothetical protein